MKKSLYFIAVWVLVSPVLAALPPTKNSKKIDPTVYQQLTGRKLSTANSVQKANGKTSSEKALFLARQSRQQKNYILAIKRYNFILKYYPKSAEAKMALTDKASLYSEMGLAAPAEYNLKKVSKLNKSVDKPNKVVR